MPFGLFSSSNEYMHQIYNSEVCKRLPLLAAGKIHKKNIQKYSSTPKHVLHSVWVHLLLLILCG